MMGKRITAFALTGWAAIIGLAWVMADRRIGLCPKDAYGNLEPTGCLLRATADRDAVIVWGLGIALAVALVVILVIARRARRRPDEVEMWSTPGFQPIRHRLD